METNTEGWLHCVPPGLGAGFRLGPGSAALHGFFPELLARAGAAAPPTGIVLTIASYETYLPGVWRALAARRAVAPFASLAPELVACPRGWAEVVEDLRGAFGAVPMRVHLRAGLGADAMPDTALAMIQRLCAAGVSLPPRQLRRLAAVHRCLPQPEPLAAFAPQQSADLARRFARDLDRIGALAEVQIEVAAAPLRAAA